MSESTKALENKASVLFNLYYASNTTLLCFFSFFLIIESYFLIPAVIVQIEIETHLVIVEITVINWSV